MPERRKYPRAHIPFTATVYNDEGKLGDYLVENVSAGGALLVSGPPIAPGMDVHLVLRGARVQHLTIDALSLRIEASQSRKVMVAIKFKQITHQLEDILHRAVLRTLEHADDPAVLLVHRDPVVLSAVARKLVALDRRPILAMTRFEVVRILSEEAAHVEAIIIDVTKDRPDAGEILDFISKRYPAILRIGLFEKGRYDWLGSSQPSLRVEAMLKATSTHSEMRRALRPRPGSDAPAVSGSVSNSIAP